MSTNAKTTHDALPGRAGYLGIDVRNYRAIRREAPRVGLRIEGALTVALGWDIAVVLRNSRPGIWVLIGLLTKYIFLRTS